MHLLLQSAPQLPDTVRQTYEHGQQLAAEKDAEGLVCVPASAVKQGQLPEGAAGSASAKSGASAGKSGGAGEAGTLCLLLMGLVCEEGPAAGRGCWNWQERRHCQERRRL